MKRFLVLSLVLASVNGSFVSAGPKDPKKEKKSPKKAEAKKTLDINAALEILNTKLEPATSQLVTSAVMDLEAHGAFDKPEVVESTFRSSLKNPLVLQALELTQPRFLFSGSPQALKERLRFLPNVSNAMLTESVNALVAHPTETAKYLEDGLKTSLKKGDTRLLNLVVERFSKTAPIMQQLAPEIHPNLRYVRPELLPNVLEMLSLLPHHTEMNIEKAYPTIAQGILNANLLDQVAKEPSLQWLGRHPELAKAMAGSISSREDLFDKQIAFLKHSGEAGRAAVTASSYFFRWGAEDGHMEKILAAWPELKETQAHKNILAARAQLHAERAEAHRREVSKQLERDKIHLLGEIVISSNENELATAIEKGSAFMSQHPSEADFQNGFLLQLAHAYDRFGKLKLLDSVADKRNAHSLRQILVDTFKKIKVSHLKDKNSVPAVFGNTLHPDDLFDVALAHINSGIEPELKAKYAFELASKVSKLSNPERMLNAIRLIEAHQGFTHQNVRDALAAETLGSKQLVDLLKKHPLNFLQVTRESGEKEESFLARSQAAAVDRLRFISVGLSYPDLMESLEAAKKLPIEEHGRLLKGALETSIAAGDERLLREVVVRYSSHADLMRQLSPVIASHLEKIEPKLRGEIPEILAHLPHWGGDSEDLQSKYPKLAEGIRKTGMIGEVVDSEKLRFLSRHEELAKLAAESMERPSGVDEKNAAAFLMSGKWGVAKMLQDNPSFKKWLVRPSRMELLKEVLARPQSQFLAHQDVLAKLIADSISSLSGEDEKIAISFLAAGKKQSLDAVRGSQSLKKWLARSGNLELALSMWPELNNSSTHGSALHHRLLSSKDTASALDAIEASAFKDKLMPFEGGYRFEVAEKAIGPRGIAEMLRRNPTLINRWAPQSEDRPGDLPLHPEKMAQALKADAKNSEFIQWVGEIAAQLTHLEERLEKRKSQRWEFAYPQSTDARNARVNDLYLARYAKAVVEALASLPLQDDQKRVLSDVLKIHQNRFGKLVAPLANRLDAQLDSSRAPARDATALEAFVEACGSTSRGKDIN